MLLSAFRNLFPGSRSSPSPRRRTARPALEPLEDRTVPSHGLISYWTGDDTTADALGTNNGTLNGGAGYAPGIIADGFQFNGVDGYFQAPTNGFPTGTSDRTIDLWAKIDAFSPIEAFFAGYGSFGANNQTYQLGANAADGRVFFSQWGQAVFGPSLNTGTWYNVAVTNTRDSVTLYLNGQSVASGNLPIDTPAATQFYMGRIPGGLGDVRRLDGEVDEVGVFRHALSAFEIRAIYEHDLQGSQASSPGASELGVASILATSIASSSPKAPIAVMPSALTLPEPVTGASAVSATATSALNATTNGIRAVLAGGAGVADVIFAGFGVPAIEEPFVAMGGPSLL
jgi:hypothetical protein